ncbi:MAG: aminoacetone oxidase family FAD-binding enzyme, partial [Acholeplasmataceae bacterium]|nr:aminoacetone oxidase family FAD-binding enzyme [Acholeplasmataceae bacterium]
GNPKTLESKIIKNLYLAGEVIDVDGYTGGYNLQAAFSTGYAAGYAAAAADFEN